MSHLSSQADESLKKLHFSLRSDVEFPANTDPDHCKRLEAFVQSQRPELESKLALLTRGGTPIRQLAGAISDGQGVAPGRMTEIIPIGLAQGILTEKLRGLGWQTVADLFATPPAGLLPILLFFEGNMGFGAIAYESIPNMGARA